MNLNLLKKIGLHCAVWAGAFCAVLVAPVILVYGVPLAIGAVSDIVHLGGGPLTIIAAVSATTCRAAAPLVA
jgi:hypothetical protein